MANNIGALFGKMTSIINEVKEVQKKIDERLPPEIDERLTHIEDRLTSIETREVSIDDRLASIVSILERIADKE